MGLIYYEQYSTGVFGQFDLTTQIWVPQNFSTVQWSHIHSLSFANINWVLTESCVVRYKSNLASNLIEPQLYMNCHWLVCAKFAFLLWMLNPNGSHHRPYWHSLTLLSSSLWCRSKNVVWLVFTLIWFGLWCLMPLSTIFQLYCGGQFYWWRTHLFCRKFIFY